MTRPTRHSRLRNDVIFVTLYCIRPEDCCKRLRHSNISVTDTVDTKSLCRRVKMGRGLLSFV